MATTAVLFRQRKRFVEFVDTLQAQYLAGKVVSSAFTILPDIYNDLWLDSIYGPQMVQAIAAYGFVITSPSTDSYRFS